MKKAIILINLIFLIISSSKAQEDKIKSILYLSSNISVFSNSKGTARISFVKEYKQSFGFSIGLSGGIIKNVNKPPEYNGEFLCFFGCGEIKAFDLSLMSRKIFNNKTKKFKLGLELGPSLTYYSIPIITTMTTSGEWVFTSYDESTNHKASAGLQARIELQYLPDDYLGFALGSSMNWNNSYPYIALDVGIIFGRLKS